MLEHCAAGREFTTQHHSTTVHKSCVLSSSGVDCDCEGK